MSELSEGTEGKYAGARRAHPGLDVPEAAYAEALARCLRRAEGTDAAGRVPADAGDLYLAVGCDRGVAGAWERLEQAEFPKLRAILARRGTPPAQADETLSDLAGLLCQPPADGGAQTRIGTYGATGRLSSWLAVIALRRVSERWRAKAPAGAEPPDVALLPAGHTAPLRTLVQEETARRFESSLRDAWVDLTARERLVVLLRYRDGLSQREIARLLGVGEPRVSRLVHAAVARLKDAVNVHLADSSSGDGDRTLWAALNAAVARRLATS